MSTDGAFSPAARAAIYTAADNRCIGCGRTDLSAQHRAARGMGGRSGAAAVTIGHPANGVALCGDGTRGCHGWAEHHPEYAARLGWRLRPGEHALTAPFWQRVYGWRCWNEELDGFVGVVYVDPEELPDLPRREVALAAFHADLEVRKSMWDRTR